MLGPGLEFQQLVSAPDGGIRGQVQWGILTIKRGPDCHFSEKESPES